MFHATLGPEPPLLTMKTKTAKPKKKSRKIAIDSTWELIHPLAAEVDIGSRKHWACVPAQAAVQPVRKLGVDVTSIEGVGS